MSARQWQWQQTSNPTVCAQTQQTSNPTVWLTEWAPESRDVYWNNLSIPFVSLTVRRLIIAVAFFFLNFFYVIPITLVQSLANLEGIEKALPFLKPLIELPFIHPRVSSWNCFEDLPYSSSNYTDVYV